MITISAGALESLHSGMEKGSLGVWLAWDNEEIENQAKQAKAPLNGSLINEQWCAEKETVFQEFGWPGSKPRGIWWAWEKGEWLEMLKWKVGLMSGVLGA